MFDVGIAEQHATTSAAGLAIGGLHPVVAVYATFLNRAFDQVLMDVALHRCGVTFVPRPRRRHRRRTGASHNGMWDLSILQVVPGSAASPRRATRRPCASELREAVAVEDAPDRRAVPQGRGRRRHPGRRDASAASTCCAAADDRDVLLVAVGAMAETCLEVAERCARQGIGVTVVDPRWVKPVPAAAGRAGRATTAAS